MGIFNFVKAGGKKFGSIVGVGPKVNKTKLDEATSKLNILKHKTKMSKSKLDKTVSDIDQASKARNKESKKMFETAEGKRDGGRISRKFGGGADMSKKLSAKQMKIASLAGNKKKIDGADFKKLKAMKKNKTPLQKAVKV